MTKGREEKKKIKEKRNEKPWCVHVDAQTVGNPKLSLPLNFQVLVHVETPDIYRM